MRNYDLMMKDYRYVLILERKKALNIFNYTNKSSYNLEF